MWLTLRMFVEEQRILFLESWNALGTVLSNTVWTGVGALATVAGLVFGIIASLPPSALTGTNVTSTDYTEPRTTTVVGTLEFPHLSSSGIIKSPQQGALVDPSFFTTGIIELGSGEIGWLAVRKGNSYWPKEPAIEKSGTWQHTVYEGGAPGPIALTLVAVDNTVNKEIINWFEHSEQIGRHSPILLNGKAKILHQIDLSLKTP